MSAIGVSYTIINSFFSHNEAIGWGANPQRTGTPGGGNGGAIYGDGNYFAYEILDTVVEDNSANEGGGGVFFVSNNRTGHLIITDSELRRNPSLGFETAGYPGIFYLGSGPPDSHRLHHRGVGSPARLLQLMSGTSRRSDRRSSLLEQSSCP